MPRLKALTAAGFLHIADVRSLPLTLNTKYTSKTARRCTAALTNVINNVEQCLHCHYPESYFITQLSVAFNGDYLYFFFPLLVFPLCTIMAGGEKEQNLRQSPGQTQKLIFHM